MSQSPTWKTSFTLALLIYLSLRLTLSLFVALLLWLTPGLTQSLQTEVMTRWGIPIPTDLPSALLLNPWLRFDAIWYLKTALNGYTLSEPNIQHLPLYPLLIRLWHTVMGGHIGLSALIIANLAFILALAYMHQLARLDHKETVARRTVLYVALFPTAFFYLIGYTEALFLLGAVGAFYYARCSRWLAAGIWGTICALARPQGILILLPLLLLYWQQEKTWSLRYWLKAWPLLLLPLGVALYGFYLHLVFGLTTTLTAYNAYWFIQPGWGIPGRGVWLNLGLIWQGHNLTNNLNDLLFALFGITMTIWAVRALSPAYALFMVLNVMLAISKPVQGYPLLSTPRFILPLFPMYILLAQASVTSPWLHRLIIYTWLALWLFFGLQFALGGWVA
jgi:hypothetical protein